MCLGIPGQIVEITDAERLLALLDAQGYRCLVAGITTPNEASVRLHERFGFAGISRTLDTIPGPELAADQTAEAENHNVRTSSWLAAMAANARRCPTGALVSAGFTVISECLRSDGGLAPPRCGHRRCVLG